MDTGQADTGPDPEQSADPPQLCPTHEQRADPLLAGLVGKPGLGGAAQTGLAGGPDHLGEQDRAEQRDAPLQHERHADDQEAEDDREAATVDVGDDARRWNLEEQGGRLQHRADEHELERVHVRGGDVVDREHPVDQALPKRVDRRQEQVDDGGIHPP